MACPCGCGGVSYTNCLRASKINLPTYTPPPKSSNTSNQSDSFQPHNSNGGLFGLEILFLIGISIHHNEQIKRREMGEEAYQKLIKERDEALKELFFTIIKIPLTPITLPFKFFRNVFAKQTTLSDKFDTACNIKAGIATAGFLGTVVSATTFALTYDDIMAAKYPSISISFNNQGKGIFATDPDPNVALQLALNQCQKEHGLKCHHEFTTISGQPICMQVAYSENLRQRFLYSTDYAGETSKLVTAIQCTTYAKNTGKFPANDCRPERIQTFCNF